MSISVHGYGYLPMGSPRTVIRIEMHNIYVASGKNEGCRAIAGAATYECF